MSAGSSPESPTSGAGGTAAATAPAATPLRRIEPVPGLPFTLSEHLHGIYELTGPGELAPPQRLVMALMAQEFNSLAHDRAPDGWWVYAAKSLAYVAIPALLLLVLGRAFRSNVPMYAVAGAYLCFLYQFPGRVGQTRVQLRQVGLSVLGITLGRLNSFTNAPLLRNLWTALFLALTCQAGLLAFSQDHLGIGEVTGVWDALLLSANNLLNGVLLGTPLLFHVHLGPHVEAMPTAAAVAFTAFRLTYVALVGFILYALLQRIRLGRLYTRMPAGPDYRPIVGWMDELPRRWSGLFHDEMLFTQIAACYVTGAFDTVRELAGAFRSLAVADGVRTLFVHPRTGELLFELNEPLAAPAPAAPPG